MNHRSWGTLVILVVLCISTTQVSAVQAHEPLHYAKVERTIRDLEHLGGDWSRGFDINPHSEVVGVTPTAASTGHAFFWSPNKGMIDIGGFKDGYSEAYALNDRGQVVGYSTTAR